MEERLKKTLFGSATNQLEALRRASLKLFDLRYVKRAHMSPGEILSEMEKTEAPANQIVKQLPKAVFTDTIVVDAEHESHNPLVQTDDITVPCDLYPAYTIKLGENKSYELQMGTLLGQGVYNHIFECTWTAEHLNNRLTDAVFKTPVLPALKLDLLMETIIHALLNHIHGREYFVHLLAAVRLPIDGWPGYQFGAVLTRHPGVDLDEFISTYRMNTLEYIAILQQVAYALLQAQSQLSFMHRDLKADNILVWYQPDGIDNDSMPESEQQLLKRPATIKVNDRLSFETCGYSIQLCDFGASFVHPEGKGEPFAVPIIQDLAEFNPRTDLAHFVVTLTEDFEEDMEKYAPEMLEFLRNYAADLFETKQKQEDRSLYDICQDEKDDRYLPLHFLSALADFRKHLDQTKPELKAHLAQKTEADM